MEHQRPYLIERIIAVLTYLTAGFAGFVWLIIALIRRVNLTEFLRYHIFQSIFIAIAYVLLSLVCELLMNLLAFIPLINVLTRQIYFFLNSPVFLGFSLIQSLIYALLIYLAATSAAGIYSRIPWISDVIDHHVR